MVHTTLDFAEKYLLKTEIISVPVSPDGADTTGADPERGAAAGDRYAVGYRTDGYRSDGYRAGSY
ncbi:MAG: hypothetical protein E6586_02580 [Bifidobacterium scardovii]|uniref:hypothetical protein n=1 Tax=Bifidobacterium scardovii TaxID=158787 RepID=UPI000666AB85|nr:hypothetical protein [Bifidobacterium scardovii]MBS6947482.1 hypothetical protein [Bifidobacterium scardovii]MDU3736797.1 hypothetical protein [Bifidobacterium scardovii]MDU5296156.1 hypothetical protein [Bifidobacterium scardovii]MDU5610804.1 hypothetical protein [Bifidobacterium scardovii]MDU5886028.1 hypothetical protein [Bifidobacterium scardovii]